MLKPAFHIVLAALIGLGSHQYAQAKQNQAQHASKASKAVKITKASKFKAVRAAKIAKPSTSMLTKQGLKKRGNGNNAVVRERLVKKVVVVHGKRRVVYQRVAFHSSIAAVPAILTVGDLAGLNHTRDALDLKSSVAYVIDQSSSQVLFEKNAEAVLPMASITKLMTGLIVVEANQNLDEMLTITEDDVDREKFSSSRLKVGVQLPRATMLHLALMSSENRAAAALGRNYPGGITAFVAAMNAKAKALGMNDTRYVDAHGLSSKNVASARDLAKLVVAAHQHPILGQFSTDTRYAVDAGGRTLNYANTNHLVANPEWEIGIQKTGYISEAGRCLVMQARIEGRPVVMIFLDSKGKESRIGDAARVRKWLEEAKLRTMS